MTQIRTHYGPGHTPAACSSSSARTTGTTYLVTCPRCLSIIAARDAARDKAALEERTDPCTRLPSITACRMRPHSMDREIRAHPKVPGATDTLDFGDPPIQFRALPLAASRYGSLNSNAPPPDWCPLPKEDGDQAELRLLRQIADATEQVFFKQKGARAILKNLLEQREARRKP